MRYKTPIHPPQISTGQRYLSDGQSLRHWRYLHCRGVCREYGELPCLSFNTKRGTYHVPDDPYMPPANFHWAKVPVKRMGIALMALPVTRRRMSVRKAADLRTNCKQSPRHWQCIMCCKIPTRPPQVRSGPWYL